MADVRREPGVALDASLQRPGHLIERLSKAVQVGVGLAAQPGVQAPPGNGLGGPPDPSERAKRPLADPRAQQGGKQGGGRPGAQQDELEGVQGPFHLHKV